MTYDEVIEHFGTQQKLGAALGIAQPTISSWGRVIPDHYQYQLEIITAGALRVEERLRRRRDQEAREQRA